MPAPKLPAAKKKEEPRAQKPDLRLPPGALRPGKAGERPLSEQLRQHEKKRKAPAKKPIEAEPDADFEPWPAALAPASPDTVHRINLDVSEEEVCLL